MFPRPQQKIIEHCHRVSFRPETDKPFDRFIGGIFDQGPVVQMPFNGFLPQSNHDLVPLAGENIRRHSCAFNTVVVHKFEEDNIVFQRIDPEDVIIVDVLEAKKRPPARSILPLISLTRTLTVPFPISRPLAMARGK